MLKKIVNLHEEITDSRLRSVCEGHGALVYPKLRLADVLPIEGSGISKEDYRFALQSHFDFLVTDKKFDPLFAVEFDGISHREEVQKKRDDRKNRLCDKFGLPLLRIKSNWLLKKYRNMDLLSWFVEVWFLRKGFYKLQERREIAPDEPFDPFSVLKVCGKDKIWPLWLSLDLRVEIKKLWESGKCKDYVPSVLIGADEKDNYHGIAYIPIDDKAGVFAETGIRNQQFPVPLTDIVDELLVYELYEELKAVLENKSHPKPLSHIYKELKSFAGRYEITMGTGGPNVTALVSRSLLHHAKKQEKTKK